MHDSVKDKFRDIIRETLCPYATTSKVAYSRPWSQDRNFRENLAAIATQLGEFCDYARKLRFHAFVCELYSVNAHEFEHVVALFRKFLISLSESDPAQSACMKTDLLQPSWQFEFSALRLFIILFAPCYEPWHPKY